jgi:hypothetical protein
MAAGRGNHFIPHFFKFLSDGMNQSDSKEVWRSVPLSKSRQLKTSNDKNYIKMRL